MDHIELIIEAQKFIIANPVRACVNSESSFVKQRLQNQGHTEAARLYWNFICVPSIPNPLNNAKEIETLKNLQKVLEGNKFVMPSWGTSGT